MVDRSQVSEAYQAIQEATYQISVFYADKWTAIEELRDALSMRSDRVHQALQILALLPPLYTEEVIPELLWRAVSETYSDKIQWLLGRMPYRESARVVPAAVYKQIQQDSHQPDLYWTYRQMGMILENLGLYDELDTLAGKAQSSHDPDVREAGDDFKERLRSNILVNPPESTSGDA